MGELSLAGEYGQIWNIIMEVLNQTVELMENEEWVQKLLMF